MLFNNSFPSLFVVEAILSFILFNSFIYKLHVCGNCSNLGFESFQKIENYFTSHLGAHALNIFSIISNRIRNVFSLSPTIVYNMKELDISYNYTEMK